MNMRMYECVRVHACVCVCVNMLILVCDGRSIDSINVYIHIGNWWMDA